MQTVEYILQIDIFPLLYSCRANDTVLLFTWDVKNDTTMNGCILCKSDCNIVYYVACNPVLLDNSQRNFLLYSDTASVLL